MSCISLCHIEDVHFPNMETVAGLILYFDGTRAYTAVTRSFATFGVSYAPGATNLTRVKLNLPRSQSSLQNHMKTSPILTVSGESLPYCLCSTIVLT